MSAPHPPAAVFFDLDGTLVDSAPDLIVAVQALCAERGAPPPDPAAVRQVVSTGGRAMLREGLPGLDEAGIDALLPRFLELYAGAMTQHTRLFDGMQGVLDLLGERAIPWGIVTNKPGWLARPLLEAMPFAARCAALVTGDCLPVRKPDPAPVLHACALAGVVPDSRVFFVGDDLRDVQAGRAAGVSTIAAAWGYLAGSDPAEWAADCIVARPDALPPAMGLA